MKKHLLIILIAVTNTGFSDWMTLETSDYSIDYHTGWTLDQSGLSGTKFILFRPVVQGQAFRNNVNLMIQDLTGQGINLSKFVNISTEQINRLVTSSNILQSQTKGSRHEIVYSGIQGQFSLKWKQYYWVESEKAYILTFTADNNSFDQDIDLVTKTMDSFKIKRK